MAGSVDPSRFRRLCSMLTKLLLAFMPILVLDAFGAPVLAKKTGFRFEALPEGAGDASVALGMHVDPDDPTSMRVAGRVRNSSGEWEPVVWRSTDGGSSWDLGHLSKLGRDEGIVHDLVIVGGQTGVVAGGAVSNLQQAPVPVLWERPAGEQWSSTILPSLGGQQGEILDVGVDDAENLALIGWSLDGDEARQAAVWMQDGQGEWIISILLPLAPGADSRANAVAFSDLLAVLSIGTSHDSDGFMRPVVWNQVGPVWTPTALDLPADAIAGQANSIAMLGHVGIIAGSYVSNENSEHGVTWTYNDDTGNWDLLVLENLPGLNNGRVLSNYPPLPSSPEPQIAVGACDNGPGSERATLWEIDENQIVSVDDLNDLTFDAGEQVLRVASTTESLIPVPIIYDLRVVAGWSEGTGLATDSHAFVLIEPRLDLFEPDPGIAGRSNTFRVERGTPGKKVHVIYGFKDGTANVPGCANVQVNIKSPKVIRAVTADGNGDVEFNVPVPNSARGLTIRFQAVEVSNCEVSNLVETTFQ